MTPEPCGWHRVVTIRYLTKKTKKANLISLGWQVGARGMVGGGERPEKRANCFYELLQLCF